MHRKNTGQKYTKTLTVIYLRVVGLGVNNFLLFSAFFRLSTMNIYYFYNRGWGKEVNTGNTQYREVARLTW